MYRIAGLAFRALVGAAVLIGLAAGPGDAQSYRTAVGVVGGWSTAGDLTPGMGYHSSLGHGWVAGAQFESWSLAGRTGWRLNATVASREMEGEQRTFTVVGADAGLMIRLLSPARERAAAPFVGLGPGLVLYFAGDGEEPLGGGLYGSDPVVRLMLAPSVGVDLRTGSKAGIRLEIADQIVFPYVGISPATDRVHRVHNPAVRVAAQLRFGRRPSLTSIATVPLDRGRDLQPAPAPAPDRPLPKPPPPPEPAPPAATPLPAARPLYTVQVGAFTGTTSARDVAGRLDGTGLPIWLTESDVGGQRLIRVRVGAVRSREEAGLLASRLTRDFGLETWIADVTADESVPADAVATTLRILFPR